MTFHVESQTNDTGTTLYRYTCDTCEHSGAWHQSPDETRVRAIQHSGPCAARAFQEAAREMGL